MEERRPCRARLESGLVGLRAVWPVAATQIQAEPIDSHSPHAPHSTLLRDTQELQLPRSLLLLPISSSLLFIHSTSFLFSHTFSFQNNHARRKQGRHHHRSLLWYAPFLPLSRTCSPQLFPSSPLLLLHASSDLTFSSSFFSSYFQ